MPAPIFNVFRARSLTNCKKCVLSVQILQFIHKKAKPEDHLTVLQSGVYFFSLLKNMQLQFL